MGHVGETLRELRESAGLTQSDVARRAGVDQSMVSVYERGHRDPTLHTLERLAHATRAVVELRVEALPDGALTIAELAAHLRQTREVTRKRRLVLDFVTRYQSTPLAARRGLFFEPPRRTGQQRWDALLGALAEHLAFEDAFDPPQWCTAEERFLRAAWFWVDLPSVRRRALIHAPTSFRRRNVWVDRADLVRA